MRIPFSFVKPSGPPWDLYSLSDKLLLLLADGYTAGNLPDTGGVSDGTNRDAVQASGPLQPAFDATDSDFNSKPAISIVSASGQFLRTGTCNTPLVQPCTIITIGKNDGGAGTQFYVDGIDGGNRLVVDKSSATVYEAFAGATAGGAIDGVNNPAPHGYTMADPSVVISVLDGADSCVYVNSEIPLGSQGAPFPFYPATVQNAGAGQALGLTIGAAVNDSASLNGKLRAVVVVAGVPSAAVIRQIVAFARTDSGISVADTFVVYDGNSNMFGAGTSAPGLGTALPAVTDAYASKRFAGWYNYGNSGNTTPQRTADMAVTFSLCDSRVTHKTVVLLEIQNDLVQNGGNVNPSDTSYAATAWANLIAYSVAARAAGFTRLVLCTCLPEGSASAAPANYEALRQAVNTLVRANYAAYFDALADIGAPGSPIGTAASAEDPALFAAVDTAHLTDAGTVAAAVILGPEVFP